MGSSLVTNGKIKSGVPNEKFRDNWDRIFSKPSPEGKEEEDKEGIETDEKES